MVNRCRWVPTNNKLYCDYHDKEWGKPIGDDQKTFLSCYARKLSVRAFLVNRFK